MDALGEAAEMPAVRPCVGPASELSMLQRTPFRNLVVNASNSKYAQFR